MNIDNETQLQSWLNLNRTQCFEDDGAKLKVAPFPPVSLMANVSGLNAERDFASHGCDIYEALSKASPMPLSSYPHVLDFGCGCGRLARLFKDHPNHFYGCDIDPRHVQWMQENLPFMETTLSSVRPPIPYEDEQFDAVISISIFTHLTESSQDQFLSELHRVCHPSGRLFLTVHGEQAMQRAIHDPDVRQMLDMDDAAFAKAQEDFYADKHAFILQQGHLTVDHSWKQRLKRYIGKVVIDDDFSYGISFVSEAYIRQHWSKWFDVERVHAGAIHNFQDIVVLRPKEKSSQFKHVSGLSKTKQPSKRMGSPGYSVREAEDPELHVESLLDKRSVLRMSLDCPKENADFNLEPIALLGWAFTSEPIRHLELIEHSGHVVVTVPFAVPRPDVCEKFSLDENFSHCGFFHYLNLYLLPESFELTLVMVTVSGTRIASHRLHGQRPPLSTPAISPLCVTTLGRTGSTALLGYLGCHPSCSVYQPFQAEARYISYWVQMFESLASGRSWQMPLVSSNPVISGSWMLGEDEKRPHHYGIYPSLFSWFNDQYVKNIYQFCSQSLSEHYLQVARCNHGQKATAQWMVEKFLPDLTLYKVKNMFPSSREIILVRDFRDVFSSILSFIRKRGVSGFGREFFDDDESYLIESFIPSVHQLHEHWKSCEDHALLVRYEDLITKPEETLQNVFTSLNIDASSTCVDAVLSKARSINCQSQLKHQTNASIQASIGSYKQKLTMEQIHCIEQQLKQVLLDFGYMA